jgi:uncharacterized protein (DUF58 family)
MSPETSSHQQDPDDGVVYISQPSLIALQREASMLRFRPGRIRSRLSGQYLSTFKGRGMEFDEARPYQPGDDIRNMDWRVTARTNRPHSKVFREERERPVLVWSDFRAPMFFGTRRQFKSVQAARVSALLAWQANRLGDRFGALLFSDKKHLEIRPATGKKTILQTLKKLSEFSRNGNHGSSVDLTMLNQSGRHALKRLVQVARPGSLIYLVSDFRDLGDELVQVVNRLALHNDVVLVHVFDPLETALPGSGRYRVSDGVDEAELNAGNRGVRDQYAQRFVSLAEQLHDLCNKTGGRFLPVSTDDELPGALMQHHSRQKA